MMNIDRTFGPQVRAIESNTVAQSTDSIDRAVGPRVVGDPFLSLRPRLVWMAPLAQERRWERGSVRAEGLNHISMGQRTTKGDITKPRAEGPCNRIQHGGSVRGFDRSGRWPSRCGRTRSWA